MEEPPTKACSNWVARKEHTQYEIVYPHSPQDHRSGVRAVTQAGLLQQLLQQTSARRRQLPASRPARRAPSPPVRPGTSPDSPKLPAPRSAAALRPPRVPASRRPPAPRSAQTAAQGGGAARAAGPRGGRTPPPGPAAFPPSPFEQLPPPSSCGPLQPLRRGGCGRYSSPRLGPRARP